MDKDIRKMIPDHLPSFSERLNWLVRHMPEETDAIYNGGKVGKKTLTRYRRGTSRPQLDESLEIAKMYGVSLNWLLEGVGDPIFDWTGGNDVEQRLANSA